MSLSNEVPGGVRAGRVTRTLARRVRGVCFWLGVVLPVVYLPLLFVSIEAFLALLPLHAAALAAGYDYSP